MSRYSFAQWAAHLRSIATAAAASTEHLGLGTMEPAFVSAVCGAPIAPPLEPVNRGEIGLWWALTDDRVDVDEIIVDTDRGSLLPRDDYSAIEVWTDADLSAVHALWRLARDRERTDWMRRVEAVRDWHLEHTQPDNATNRPWALHVFLVGGSAECAHYAETLLHNCMSFGGVPDALSAWILIDAANALDTMA
jgi:hypothetical protein